MSTEPLRAVIRRHESLAAGEYEAVWGGIRQEDRPRQPLTSMTVREVLNWQDSIDARYMSEAAGAYQILEDTLRGLYREAGVPLSTLYDRQTQDQLCDALLRRRGLDDFLAGRMTEDAFMLSLAKEWASFPLPHDVNRGGRTVKAGSSYYAGDGLNKAHAGIEEVRAAVRAIKAKPAPTPKDPIVARIDKGAKDLAKGGAGAGALYGAGRIIDSAPAWAIDALWGGGLVLAFGVGAAVLIRVMRARA